MNRRLAMLPWFACAATAVPAPAQSTPDWYLLPTAHAPSGRWSFDQAYDALRQRTVLFGGGTVGNNDTWVFDGVDWQQLQPATVPPWRSLHAMAYDSARDRVVLFGGMGMPLPRNDTWEWNGSDWLQRSPTVAPPLRAGHRLAYDPLRQCTVLFGGAYNGVPRGDTWTWDGTAWTLRSTPTAPAARADFDLCWDGVRQQVVLFGGHDGTTLRDDTWSWDGSAWLAAAPVHAPTPRSGHAMAFDAGRGVVVLHGGNDSSGVVGDTFEWNGSDWTAAVPAHPPGASWGHRLTYDQARARVQRFGGTADGLHASAATWLFHAPQVPGQAAAFGQGCAGTGGVPVLLPRTPPWLGEDLRLDLTHAPALAPCLLLLGWSATAWPQGPLPAELTAYGMPGCWLYTDLYLVQPALADAAGTAAWSLSVPAQPLLLGVRFYHQGLVADPAANAGGFVTTAGGLLGIGARN